MRTYIFILFLIINITSFSQKMEVVSFKAIPKDMTAQMDAPKTDMNDDKCAVIKVVTTETGFTWDIGSLSIISAEHKVGEYWLYVPYGAKGITIKHNDFGIIRNYAFNIPIEKARVYELVLKTEKHLVADGKGNFTINTTPSGAEIIIDGIPAFKEKTPFSTSSEYKAGAYKFTITKDKYYTLDTILVIQKDVRTSFDFELKPIVGSLNIETNPNDAEIFIDDKSYGTTPKTINDLLVGNYKLELKKKGFVTFSEQIVIKENEETKIHKPLADEVFVQITSTPKNAEIFLNGKNIGNTPKNIPIKLGKNNITLKKYKYVETSKSENITETSKSFDYKLISDNLLVVNKKIKSTKNIMYSSLGVGIGALSVGGYLQYSANKHYTEYQDATNTESATKLHTTINNEIRNSYIAFGVGSVGLLTAAFFNFKLWKLKKDKACLSFIPTTDGVLLSMKLTF